MADLTEKHLDDLLSGYSSVTGTNDIFCIVAEIRRHRAAMGRLEVMAKHLGAERIVNGKFAEAVIRLAIKGDANG